MASPLALFASPLGPMHHQPPSAQGNAARTLLAFLRRDRPSKASPPSPKTLQKRSPSYATLDCAFEHSAKSTYTALDEPAAPPPPYTQALAANLGQEEDLVVVDDVPAPAEEVKEETTEERKERQRREKQERKRAQLLAEDRRIEDALVKMGLI